MRCIPHGRWWNCVEHAGSDKSFENRAGYSLISNRIMFNLKKGKENAENSGSESRIKHASSV